MEEARLILRRDVEVAETTLSSGEFQALMTPLLQTSPMTVTNGNGQGFA